LDKKESILIVDDDESTGDILTLILNKKGYKTEIARTGREALEKARRRFFNLALLDIRLPDMEGIELIAPLKEIHPDMVMVIVTAYASVDNAVRALNEGASGYITKPLSMDKLLTMVREELEKQHLIMENRRLYQTAQQELFERKRAEYDLNKRVKELNCLYGIGLTNLNLIEKIGSPPEEIYQEVANLLPEAWQYPEITAARITIDSKEFKTENYRKTRWQQSSDIKVNKAKAGTVEITYLEQKPEADEGPFLKEERLLISAVAEQLGRIAERKRAEKELKCYSEKLRELIEEITQAIAATAELRDPYTAGHQQRVAQLACAIAREMKLGKEIIKEIRVAGTLHDIGKIHIPSEILTKPGRLTEIEFNLIKTHPEAGYNILKTIEFPWPVAPVVFQHHERSNGSGYPSGLSAKDILPEARILAVADVVEAMSSHRPYRPACGIDKALAEISQNRGTLYDPQVVDVCLKLFAEKSFRFTQAGTMR